MRMKPPCNVDMMCERPLPLLTCDTCGCGPLGFGYERAPLALATSTASPSEISDVGYQPVGTRPASLSSPEAVATFDVRAERLNTATAFASASATKRRVPSVDNATAFGVDPSSGPAGGGSSNRATTFSVV